MPRGGGSTDAVFRARCFEGETGHRRATPRPSSRFLLFPDPPGRFTKLRVAPRAALFFDVWRTFKKKGKKGQKTRMR